MDSGCAHRFRTFLLEDAIMISINVPSLTQHKIEAPHSLAAVSTAWFGRASVALKVRLANVGVADRLLSLNDHMLRDIGEVRTDLESRILFRLGWLRSDRASRL
jgi:hypothetical protein